MTQFPITQSHLAIFLCPSRFIASVASKSQLAPIAFSATASSLLLRLPESCRNRGRIERKGVLPSVNGDFEGFRRRAYPLITRRSRKEIPFRNRDSNRADLGFRDYRWVLFFFFDLIWAEPHDVYSVLPCACSRISHLIACWSSMETSCKAQLHVGPRWKVFSKRPFHDHQ